MLVDSIMNESGEIAIEVGTGTGYIALSVRAKFNLIVASDISFDCLRIFKDKIKKLNIWNIDLIVCDLLSAFRGMKIDLIFFNPPYLPDDGIKTDIDESTIYNRNNK